MKDQEAREFEVDFGAYCVMAATGCSYKEAVHQVLEQEREEESNQ